MVFFPPKKPTVMYDGQCGFCQAWVRSAKRLTRETVDYAPLQTARADHPGVCEACEQSIHLFMPDGSIYRGAQAVLKVWSLAGRWRSLLWMYEHVPGFKWAAEMVYKFISKIRRRIPIGLRERRG